MWCTGKNLFQETMGLGNMIQDIHRMLTEEDTRSEGQMHYIHQLKIRKGKHGIEEPEK